MGHRSSAAREHTLTRLFFDDTTAHASRSSRSPHGAAARQRGRVAGRALFSRHLVGRYSQTCKAGARGGPRGIIKAVGQGSS
jgi:hypothetical protein